MKFTSIFYKASAVYIRLKSKYSKRRDKKKQVNLFFYSEPHLLFIIFARKRKYTNKRAKKIKFTLYFHSERRKYSSLPQIYKQASEKNKVYFRFSQRALKIFTLPQHKSRKTLTLLSLAENIYPI